MREGVSRSFTPVVSTVVRSIFPSTKGGTGVTLSLIVVVVVFVPFLGGGAHHLTFQWCRRHSLSRRSWFCVCGSLGAGGRI